MQARAYADILSTYGGRPLSVGADGSAADSSAARQQFEAGQGGLFGFARSQINGVFGAPIGAWRVMSFIFDIVRCYRTRGPFLCTLVRKLGQTDHVALATVVKRADSQQIMCCFSNGFGRCREPETIRESIKLVCPRAALRFGNMLSAFDSKFVPLQTADEHCC